MSTPNPLIPQGTFQAQGSKGASNVRIAVATIIAIHVVFFGGLLLQGCKRDINTASKTTETNSLSASNLSLPPIDSGSLFYTNASHLPADTTASASTNAQTFSQSDAFAPSTTTNASRDPWRSSNLGATGNLTPQDQTPSGTKEYTVVRGDTLGKIAKANGTTLAALRKANPNIDPAKLRAGMKLQIPAAASTTRSTQIASAASTDASGSAPSSDTYTVKTGDTLTKIAKAHNVSVKEVRVANNLKTSSIKVGQKLKIPPPSAAGISDAATTGHTNSTTKVSRSKTNSTRNVAQ